MANKTNYNDSLLLQDIGKSLAVAWQGNKATNIIIVVLQMF
jgi:hypothetical protein